jgi:glycosyltransferase involved in cell wall biosynthesis
MRKRILFLTRYSSLGASSRLRTFQYVDALLQAGYEVEILPLFGNEYLSGLYASDSWALFRMKSAGSIMYSYIQRINALVFSNKPNVVWVEKEVFPYLPSIFESLLHSRGIPYVVDYDDAIFHNYDLHQSSLVRKLLGNKLASLIANSYAVTAGNAYLARYASSKGAKRVEIFPTVVDLNRYALVRNNSASGRALRIGWIGSPATSHYLNMLEGPLRMLSQQRDIVLVTIGAKMSPLRDVPWENRAWSLETECSLISEFDVGIMPLSDSPWERGKCGYKLIQYMACGLPVVASPVGVNPELVTHDVGFLAGNEQEWGKRLTELFDNPSLRLKMGSAGRKRVEEHYSLQSTIPRLLQLLDGAVQSA